jgi:hypothetical protein
MPSSAPSDLVEPAAGLRAANGHRPLAEFCTVHFAKAVVATAELGFVVNAGVGQLIDMKKKGSIAVKDELISSTGTDVTYAGLA